MIADIACRAMARYLKRSTANWNARTTLRENATAIMAKPIRIGLDIAPMHYPYSGVRAYVEALIAAFRNRDSGIELVPISSPNGLMRSSHRLSRLLWDIHGVAGSTDRSGVDALHMTRFAAPLRFDSPLLVTVHDLIPLQLSEYRASRPARIQAELARRAVPHASRVIVPSNYVASVVESELQIDRDRIEVIPMGVAPVPQERLPRFLTGPYILHTGGFDARKNLIVLLHAFARARRELGADWRLVLVGAPHSRNTTVNPPVWPVVEELGLSDRVVLTGRVSEREKHALYRHATVAVNPSLSEGFGLPILEAMAHGIPVVASNRTSHPEVSGDAALLVEPTVDGLVEAFVLLASDSALRSDLAERGRARAAQFPWSRTADATAAAYGSVLNLGT